MRARGLAFVVPALLAATVALAPPATAHPVLAGSEPSSGATLSKSPAAVRLEFNETISERFRQARLLNGRGRVVGGTTVSVAADRRSLVLELPGLRRDTYEVVWEVLAAGDGHVTGGAMTFGVGVKPSAAPRSAVPGGAPPVTETGLRWLDFALRACLLGGLAVGLVIMAAARRRAVEARVALAATRRVLGLAAVGGAGAVLLGVVLGLRQAGRLAPTLGPDGSAGDALGRLLGDRWGSLWLIREGLLLALVTLALVLRRRANSPPPAVAAIVAGALGLGLTTVAALGGHSAAAAHAWLAVPADSLHLLAAATWIGVILTLAAALWPRGAVGRRGAAALARSCGRPLSILAAASVVTLGLTGLYAAGVQVASVDALLTTFYGRALLAKLALLALAGLLGVANAALLRRLARGTDGATQRRASRLLLLEGAVGLEILVAAAVLVSASPPRGPEFAPPSSAPGPALVSQSGDLLVSATVRPNRPGTNVVTVLAASSRRPPPAPVERITAIVSQRDGGRSAVRLAPFASGRWSGGVRLPESGRSSMAVVVRRAKQRLAHRFAWSVMPPDRARPVSVSTRRLAPIVHRAALAGLLLAVCAPSLVLIAGRVRRGPGRRRAGPPVARSPVP